jgi:hypothetical protein
VLTIIDAKFVIYLCVNTTLLNISNTMNKFLSATALVLLISLIVQNTACRKEIPYCSRETCPGMLTCNQDDICACYGDQIQLPGTSLCFNPKGYNFLAQQSGSNCLPSNFILRFRDNPDSIRHDNPNQGISAMISYIWSGPKSFPNSTYKKFDVNPDGLVGDRFWFYPALYWRPTGDSRDGRCNYVIEGEWTHPDTLATIVRIYSCDPDDLPEVNNQYRVSFIRIK